VLREMPDARLGYPDARGAPELRRAIAGHLRRVRGVVADAETVVICSGTAQALGLLARALGGSGSPAVAVEDPGLPHFRIILEAHGAVPVPVAVDGDGLVVDALPDEAWGALVTPSHQSPLGVGLAPARRPALLEWAAAAEGRVVIEDDYDAEFRFDRAPLSALQGLAPDRVVYVGTASKSLAPALRLGWIVAPPRLVDAIAVQKALADHGAATLDQLVLARLIDSGALDRHLRQARRRYRARRDALVAAVARHLPGARVTGLAAGLHAVVRLPEAVDGVELVHAAMARSVGVYALGYGYAQIRPVDDGLVLGYANLPEPSIDEGIRRLAEAYAAVAGTRTSARARGRSRTNDGGAIRR
jgi:GntR family transcriptional regulator/MocR family aminotransferase